MAQPETESLVESAQGGTLSAVAVLQTDPPQQVVGRLLASSKQAFGTSNATRTLNGVVQMTLDTALTSTETFSVVDAERCVTVSETCTLCNFTTCGNGCGGGRPPQNFSFCTPTSTLPPFFTPTAFVTNGASAGTQTVTNDGFTALQVGSFSRDETFEMTWQFQGVPAGTAIASVELTGRDVKMTVPTTDFAISGESPTLGIPAPSGSSFCQDTIGAQTAVWMLPGSTTDTVTIVLDPDATCAESSSSTTMPPGGGTVSTALNRSFSDFEGRFTANGTPGDGEFEIRIAAFIPGNYVAAPPPWDICFEGPVPSMGIQKDTIDRGDDRFTVDTSGTESFRLRETVTVIPNENIDADGIVEGSVERIVGLSREYADDALENGPIPGLDDSDDDETLRDCVLLNRKGQASNSDMTVDVVRVSPNAVVVSLQASVGNPLYGFSGVLGPISWDLEVTIDISSGAPLLSVSGEHGSFPAFELFVDDVPVYVNFPDPIARLIPPPPHHTAGDALLGLNPLNRTTVEIIDAPL